MITSNATVMVVVFFVLSGFFMAYSFDKTRWKTLDFYWNRSLRIYIPYLFSIFLAVCLLLLSQILNPELFESRNPREYNADIITAYNDLGIDTFLKSLFFRPKNNYIAYNYPYWSLYVEAIFYLICPLIFFKRPNWFYLLSILLVLLNLYSIFSSYELPKILNPTFYFYAFAIGIFTYNFFKSNYFNNYIFSFLSQKNLFFDVILILVFLLVMLGGIKFEKKIFYIIAGIFTPLYIGRVLFYERSVWVKNYINPIMIFLGKISFSLYLIHVPFFILFYSILVKFSGKETFDNRIYWIFVLLVIPFGFFMYKLVEEKSLTFIRKMRANKH
jgi:peptidoglycan/LPS O-acetylase OafA/YrhL